MGNRIFINYRRSDTQTEARLLYDFLNQYEVEKLFYDIDKIELGNNFIEKIEHVLKHETDSVLVLIGHHWENELQKRIDAGEDDYVVEEIDMALAYDLDMIPLLFYRKMPDISRLARFQRSRIKQRLPFKNGMEIRPDKLQDDFAKLADKLGLSLKPTPKQEDITHLHTEIANLFQQLKEARNKDQDIEKQFIEKEQVLAQAKQSIENLQAQIALSKKTNEENERAQTILNQQLKEAKANYQALQTRYNENEQLLTQAKQTIANLETQLAQAQKTAVQTTLAPSITNDLIEMVYVEGGTF